jgi:hypothetical protein
VTLDPIMKTIVALLMLPGILLICVIGCAAALCRFKRLDTWCKHQLTDTDNSEAKGETHLPKKS